MSEEQNVEKVDYTGTLNLPKTSFKMKAKFGSEGANHSKGLE